MFRRSYKAPHVRVVLKARAWRRVPMKLLKWGRKMPSTKQYNLVPNDEYDTRIPLHPDEAFAYGITFQAKMHIMRAVRKYVIHRDYQTNNLYADIALMMLKSPLPMSNTIKRVIIRPSFPEDNRVSVAGWGVINEANGETAVKLKKIGQFLKPSAECRKSYSAITTGMFCATSNKKSTHPAEGDSGSALITSNFQQVGLVSFRPRGHHEMVFYTNVSYHFNWIKATSVLLYCPRKKAQ